MKGTLGAVKLGEPLFGGRSGCRGGSGRRFLFPSPGVVDGKCGIIQMQLDRRCRENTLGSVTDCTDLQESGSHTSIHGNHQHTRRLVDIVVSSIGQIYSTQLDGSTEHFPCFIVSCDDIQTLRIMRQGSNLNTVLFYT
ncbi:hypothetical protein PMAYCL1PPCAC_18856 [Pristionchus mayeri]|uniref:Uncharacterized protein n=1 Tax=Pristionchus mayeri TaxID=1317129 RepID=A0AAN5I2H6_9BILA|nr:hypothetical protein PMAYCL1PPCAC_18856 [Pristionchus mayeri]